MFNVESMKIEASELFRYLDKDFLYKSQWKTDSKKSKN